MTGRMRLELFPNRIAAARLLGAAGDNAAGKFSDNPPPAYTNILTGRPQRAPRAAGTSGGGPMLTDG